MPVSVREHAFLWIPRCGMHGHMAHLCLIFYEAAGLSCRVMCRVSSSYWQRDMGFECQNTTSHSQDRCVIHFSSYILLDLVSLPFLGICVPVLTGDWFAVSFSCEVLVGSRGVLLGNGCGSSPLLSHDGFHRARW